jgi:hypothetical protein
MVAVILISWTVFIFAIVCFVAHYVNKRQDKRMQNSLDLKEAFLEGWESKDKVRILKQIKLAEIDLLYHVARVYLVGNNSNYSPWRVPKNPPTKLASMISKKAYSQWSDISDVAGWSKIEKFIMKALYVLFPPIGFLYYHNCEKNAVKRLTARFALYKHDSFWKSMEEMIVKAHERTKAIKLTFSPDNFLSYIDFLDLSRSKDDYTGPELPLTFMWSGIGSYLHPFTINITDPLLISIVNLFHDPNVLQEFYLKLNVLVSRISFYDFPSTTYRCISEVLELIHKTNRDYFIKNKYKIYLYMYETKLEKSKEYEAEFSNKFPLNIKILKPEFQSILKALIDDVRIKNFRRTHDIKFAMIIDNFDKVMGKF